MKKQRPKDSIDDEWFSIEFCMWCGRRFGDGEKNYTVKSYNSYYPAIVCKNCTSRAREAARLITPYISFDAFYDLNRMGGY